MYEIRFHGRGGQGVVTAAELLSVAAFAEGRYAQAFPSFGSERTGAPVMAFCRIDSRPIRLREPVLAPHALVVQDATLLRQVDVLGGLRPGGLVLLNSATTADRPELAALAAPPADEPPDGPLDEPVDEPVDGPAPVQPPRAEVVTVAATRLALEHVGRPVPNAALLGAFAAASGQVRLDSIIAAIRQRFPRGIADGNAAAATGAYELVREQRREAVDA